MNLDHTTLEHVVTALLQHLRLGCVHNIAEIHVIGHLAFERHFDRFRDRHGGFAGCQGQGDGAGIRTKGHAFGHTRVAVAADDDGPIIHGDVI